MNGRRLRPLLLPVGVAFFQNMLLIFGEPGKVTPADMLINAFVSRQTGEFRSAMILAMENAGQLIEDEELRAQIKGSGIGTSATRAEILKKLVNIEYLALNKKTQVLTPTQMGEMIYDVVSDSIRPLLNPALTASWEKGLTMVADGVITPEEYMGKLTDFVGRRTTAVRSLNNQGVLWRQFQATEEFYQKKTKQSNAKNKE